MSAASSRRAAAAAPSAKRRTPPLSRTGSAEGGWERKSGIQSAWPASSYTSENMAAWESGNGDPLADIMDDIHFALDGLESRDSGDRRSSSDDISV